MDKLEIQRINELYTETLPFILSDETYNFLQSLPNKQRLCFILRHAYSYSYKQIAETLEISANTVRNHLAVAMKKKPQ